MKELKHDLRCHKYLKKPLSQKRSLKTKLEFLKKALNDHPEDEAELLFETGLTYICFHNSDIVNCYKTGRRYYKRALAFTSNPNLRALIYWRFAKSYSDGFGTPAIADADKKLKYLLLANKLVPEDRYILEGIADIYLKKEDYKKAEIYFERIYQLYPNNVRAMYHLGSFEQDRNNLPGAQKYYNKIFKKKKAIISQLKVCNNLRSYYRKVNDTENEFIYIKKAYEVLPATHTCFDLGNYYMNVMNAREAEKYYYEGVLDSWDFFNLEKDLNEILFSSIEEINEAIEYLEHLDKRKFPKNMQSCAFFALYKLYESINKEPETKKFYLMFMILQEVKLPTELINENYKHFLN